MAQFRITDVGKPQIVRLMDVVFIGPLMIWMGNKATGVPSWTKDAMVGLGIATIIYNLKNYMEIRELMQQPKKAPKIYSLGDI